jgi:Protein of unknown function (DUF3021)
MKTFYNIAYEMKALMALFFMSIILTYGMVCIAMGNNTMPLELIWEFVLLSVLISAIQFLLYDDNFLNDIPTRIKVPVHYIIILLILIIFINYFNWIELWGISFSIFIMIYTFYFIAVTLNFYFYKKITGERFNDKLIKYKEKL